jgi:hypothetical protein
MMTRLTLEQYIAIDEESYNKVALDYRRRLEKQIRKELEFFKGNSDYFYEQERFRLEQFLATVRAMALQKRMQKYLEQADWPLGFDQ